MGHEKKLKWIILMAIPWVTICVPTLKTAETEGTGRTTNQADTKEWANPREEVIFMLVLLRKVEDVIWVAMLLKER